METNGKITPDTTIEITISAPLKDAPGELRRLFMEKIRKRVDSLVLEIESLEDSKFSIEGGSPLPHPVPISILERLEQHSISAALLARECRQQLIQLAEIQREPMTAPGHSKSLCNCSGSKCAATADSPLPKSPKKEATK